MKRILNLLICFIGLLHASAQDPIIRVVLHSGETIDFAFDSGDCYENVASYRSQIVYFSQESVMENGETATRTCLVIKSPVSQLPTDFSRETLLQIPITELKGLTFRDEATGIEQIKNKKVADAVFKMNMDGTIEVSMMKTEAPVLLYNAHGFLLQRIPADVGGKLKISLASYPVGHYIIKIGKTSFKTYRK